jgi:hypothetical protein
MLTVNERTSTILSLTFTNEYGAPVTPTGGRYMIDDVLSGTNIVDWTGFTPVGSTYDISIASDDNRILDETNNDEVRRVTVIMYYAGDKQSTTEYRYEIVNLHEVPPTLYLVGTGGAVAGGSAA